MTISDSIASTPAGEPPMSPPELSRTVADVVIDQLSTGYDGPAAETTWLPPLRQPTALDSLLQDRPPRAGHMTFPLGVVDLPYRLTQIPWWVTLDGPMFSAAIGGGSNTGKSTLLQTLVYSLAYTHDPHDVAIFCLDFSGGKLVQLEALPHVMSVATKSDIPRISRIFGELRAVGDRRQSVINSDRLGSWERYRELRRSGGGHDAAADPYGDIVVILDGWNNFCVESWVPSNIKNGHENFMNTFRDIVRDGSNHGIHCVVTTTRWPELRDTYRDFLPLIIELKPANADNSPLGSKATRTIPDSPPGRALSNHPQTIDFDGEHESHQHIMIAAPRFDGHNSLDGIEATSDVTHQHIIEHWKHSTHKPPPKLKVLPPRIAMAKLLAEQAVTADDDHVTRWSIPLGLAESTVRPLLVNLAKNPNILVFGASESGKTSAARAIAQGIAAQNSPDQVRFVMVSRGAELWESVPEDYMLSSPHPDMKSFIQNSDELKNTFAGVQHPDDPTKNAPGLLELFAKRRIPSGMSPTRAAQRDWWPASYEIVIIIDDWHKVFPSIPLALAGLAGLNDYIQTPHSGIHFVATCQVSELGKYAYGQGLPISTAWNGHTSTLILSGSHEHSPNRFVAVTHRPPGQAALVLNSEQRDVIQIGYPHQ